MFLSSLLVIAHECLGVLARVESVRLDGDTGTLSVTCLMRTRLGDPNHPDNTELL